MMASKREDGRPKKVVQPKKANPNGRIGWVSDKRLGIRKDGKSDGGHFSYLEKDRKGYRAYTITSIEDKKPSDKFTIKLDIDGKGHYRWLSEAKLRHIRNGNLYPIPAYDINTDHWSGINESPVRRKVYEKDIQSLDKKKIVERKPRKFFFKQRKKQKSP